MAYRARVTGTATLVLGTATVNTSVVTANSLIFLTPQSGGALGGTVRVSAINAGTSFTILSTNLVDTAVIAWEIVN